MKTTAKIKLALILLSGSLMAGEVCACYYTITSVPCHDWSMQNSPPWIIYETAATVPACVAGTIYTYPDSNYTPTCHWIRQYRHTLYSWMNYDEQHENPVSGLITCYLKCG